VEHFGILLAILLFAFYFLPTLIAEKRKVPHSGTIFLINLLLGWTVLGWIAALVWGVVETSEEPGSFKGPLDHVG
jgi:hypothetical protein